VFRRPTEEPWTTPFVTAAHRRAVGTVEEVLLIWYADPDRNPGEAAGDFGQALMGAGVVEFGVGEGAP